MDMANLDKLKERHHGKTPWWLNSNMRNGIAKGYEKRFYKWGLDKVYGNFTRLAESHDWHNFEGLKYQIEGIRKNSDISGYCITAFCDDFFQPFGLLDYFREPKVFHKDMAKIQGPNLLIADWTKLNFYPGEIFEASIYLSHISEVALKDCTLKWSLAESDISGEVKDINIKRIGSGKIADIQFRVPTVKINKGVRLKISLEQNGKIVTENYLEIYLFLENSKRFITEEEINVHDPEARLLENLRQNGARVNEGLRNSIPFAIATVIDEQVKEYVSKGGRALILQEDTLVDIEMGLTIGEPLFFVDSPFYYLKKSLFPEIPFDNPLKWPFYKVFPDRVMANLDRIDSRDILAGCFSPFIRVDIKISEGRRPEDYKKRLKDELAAAIAKFNYGGGKIIISTFKLIESYGSKDPVATIILHNLIQYLVRGFDSQTSIPLDKGQDSFVSQTGKLDNF